jgi:hypothetical protein
LAQLMTAGVDVWLNTPEPPLEAPGAGDGWHSLIDCINDNCLSNVLVGYALLWEVRHAPTGEPG